MVSLHSEARKRLSCGGGSLIISLDCEASSVFLQVGAVTLTFLREGIFLPWSIVFWGDRLLQLEWSGARLSWALLADCCGGSVAFAPAVGCLDTPLTLMVDLSTLYLDGMHRFQGVI